MQNYKQPGKFIGNEMKYVKEVLESDMKSATGGSWNNKLETAFAKKFHSKYAIACNSGTSALHACLSAAGVGPGDEVISPGLTVMMNTFAILYQNAIPVYADIDPETFNIDPRDIERKITPKTKAIFTVSLYGLPPDMDPILELAKKYNLIVIEDNAQCYLSTYKGRLAGTFGDMSIWSFENSKHIAVGEGGIITTNDERLAERARKCAGIGFKNLRAEEGRIKLNEEVFQDPDYKRHDYLGWNYRLPEINAAVALAQLERLEELVDMRVKIANLYQEAIKGCSWLVPQKVPKGYTHSYWTFAIKYEGEKEIGVSWKDFYRTYKEMGGDGFYAAWSVPYLEPVMAEGKYYQKGSHYTGPKIEYKKGLCPVAERIQPKLMQFKTNYRSLELAKIKADALRKTIEKLSK
jgi:perosamine synthetase